MNKGSHLRRVDFVHLGTHEHKSGCDFFVVVLIQVKAELNEFPEVGDGKIESALGKVEFFTEPENPFGGTPPISFLDGLDRRRGAVVVLILEAGQRCSFVQLIGVEIELW